MSTFDSYADYEYTDHSRNTHRQRNGRMPKQIRYDRIGNLITDLRAMDDSAESWVPTYVAALDPKHHERQWVIDSLSPFYRDNAITDVTRLVKGGKEANVYCCDAHAATNLELIAAKLYRPRMLRHLKNDAIYKAGRTLRDELGKQIKGRRVNLAMEKKTSFGKEVDIQWWIGNEYRVQTDLFDLGADVPRPIAHQGNTILMAFVGDDRSSAPTLSDTHLSVAAAQTLFRRVMDNVALMLTHHLIHGDLSAYNILYWHGRIYLIDFPQVVDARTNPHAETLLQRDVTRVCDYFNRYGLRADPRQLTRDLWGAYNLEAPV